MSIRRRSSAQKASQRPRGPQWPGGLAREVGHGGMLLAVSGCSVGGFLGMVALGSRALGG